MKPMFTVHEGEFLVGDHINRNLGKKYDVWVPTKDTGVDLLVTSKAKGRKPVSLQVKFSRSFAPIGLSAEEVLAFGWYALVPESIRKSRADLWAFVVLTLRHKAHFVLVPTRELRKRIPKGRTGKWHLYLTVLRGRRCYDLRGLTKGEQQMTLLSGARETKRDYSEFYDNWKQIDELSR